MNPRMKCDPSTSFGKWDPGKKTSRFTSATTNKQSISPTEFVPLLVLANPRTLHRAGAAWDSHKCREALQGTGWSKMVAPLFSSRLGWLHSWSQQTCHVSSGVHSPSGPCFWWPCFKEKVLWKWEVRFGLKKKGAVEGKVLNTWCSTWACWVNVPYSIPKQNTGKASR